MEEMSIPTVDLSDPDVDNLVRTVAAAGREWGIFQVVHHGIPESLIEQLQAAGKAFFELPETEKQGCAKPPGARSLEGYGRKEPDDKCWVDFLFHRIWPPSIIDYSFWPLNPPSYREVNEEYAKHVTQVANKLFTYLSLGLGLQGHVLKDASGGDHIEYMMKINYYPPCPNPGPDPTLGVVAHTDLAALTILIPNDIPGLQVLKDGRWIDAEYVPNALIVHVGDQLQILSNGAYKAVVHRTTVDMQRTRMSWPVFLEPPEELEVGPLPQLAGPRMYETKTFKDYKYCKLNNVSR